MDVLRKRKFSVLIDEPTDISSVKCICTFVRYFNGERDCNTSNLFLVQLFKDDSNEENQVRV